MLGTLGSRLCRVLGFWFFGCQHAAYDTLEELYRAYEMASMVLEHFFSAYLRAQSGLPPRLEELVQTYPPERGPAVNQSGSKHLIYTQEHWSAVHVVVGTERSGILSSKPGDRSGRVPGNALAAAMLADSVPDESMQGEIRDSWAVIIAQARSPDLVEGQIGTVRLDKVMSEETERIFGVLAERQASEMKTVTLPRAHNGIADFRPALNQRRRSASLDNGSRNPTQ